jgi:hypothetical protein
MTFTRLTNENSLEMCEEVYGVAKSTTSIVMKFFCE